MLKNIVSAIGFITISMTATLAQADDQFIPRLVTAPVERVFVPVGFDNNDNTEIILHGKFPNTCYKMGPSTFTIDNTTHTIEINAQAYKYDGGCAQIMVPFTQAVPVGILKEGLYDVVIKNRPDARTSRLDVAEATTSNPDDYLYASVDNVSITDMLNRKKGVNIMGNFPHMLVGCMIMKEVRTIVTAGDVIVVLPIAELVDDQRCQEDRYSYKFSVTAEISGDLLESEYLVHVRVTAGGSLNKYYINE